MSESPNHHIELISKMLQVVEALRDAPDGLTLHELATQTGQVKSSVHRILRSLAHHGYIEQPHRGGAYRLGVQFLVLAGSVRAGSNMVELTRPFSRDLKETFDESTYIAVLRGGQGVFVDVQETHRDLRLVGPLGARVDFETTAAGKAMAAFFPESVLGKRLPVWDRVRQQGYAVNDEETIPGAIFIAAPIFDSRGAICGAISIGLPKPRCTAELFPRIAAETRAACDRATRALEAARYVHTNAFEEISQGAVA